MRPLRSVNTSVPLTSKVRKAMQVLLRGSWQGIKERGAHTELHANRDFRIHSILKSVIGLVEKRTSEPANRRCQRGPPVPNELPVDAATAGGVWL
jgi:hypothetical protein